MRGGNDCPLDLTIPDQLEPAELAPKVIFGLASGNLNLPRRTNDGGSESSTTPADQQPT